MCLTNGEKNMPFCSICEKDVEQTIECIVCGEKFCPECGKSKEKLCLYCNNEDDWEDYEDEEEDAWSEFDDEDVEED